MLTLFRRHLKDCKKGYPRAHREKERGDCSCPVYVQGRIGGDYIKEATGTASMERARALAVEAETRGSWATPKGRAAHTTLIVDAVALFLKELESKRGKSLAGPTVGKYKTLLRRLVEHSASLGLNYLSELSFEILTGFKDSLPYTAADPARNAVTRLRKFFQFAVKMSWIKENPAPLLEMPREENVERLPFSPDEESRIYRAAATMTLDVQQPITNHELQTFCYLMRYSGMAIADAALLQKSELRGDEIRYYRKKTRRSVRRVHVVVPLPEWLVERIKALPLQNGTYYFCHGSTLLVSAVDVWHSRLRRLFQVAEVRDGGSHRFRHTFATRLLEAGESLEDVSRWLGHASVKTTEKYYSHWLESRIKKSSDKLRRRYAQDDPKPSEPHAQE